MDYDLFVIGGGSGGVRCARIAASHGARVAIAEERYWGGTCVNVGCVPKKLMVQAAEYGVWAADSHGFGWNTRPGEHDWAALMAAKDAEIKRLNGIYVRLLETAGVDWLFERAVFIDAHTLRVGERIVTAERIVIAVGGHPSWPEIDGAELGIVSDQAFYLPERPRRVTMVGGGYIGVEFAGIFRGLGSDVDLLYRQRMPLRGFDHDLREALVDSLQESGIRLHPSVMLHRLERLDDGSKRLHLTDGRSFDSDLVFFAVGRVPNTKGLGLEAAGVTAAANGAVVVDPARSDEPAEHLCHRRRVQQDEPHACGDCRGSPSGGPAVRQTGAQLVVRGDTDGGVLRTADRHVRDDGGAGGRVRTGGRVRGAVHADAAHDERPQAPHADEAGGGPSKPARGGRPHDGRRRGGDDAVDRGCDDGGGDEGGFRQDDRHTSDVGGGVGDAADEDASERDEAGRGVGEKASGPFLKKRTKKLCSFRCVLRK